MFCCFPWVEVWYRRHKVLGTNVVDAILEECYWENVMTNIRLNENLRMCIKWVSIDEFIKIVLFSLKSSMSFSIIIFICSFSSCLSPQIELKTAPADFRFPTTNQTRHCFTRYIEFHRCIFSYNLEWELKWKNGKGLRPSLFS